MQKACYKNLLEIACFTIESCIEAQKSGADRIEFCADYALGGITPKHEDILRVRELLHIPFHVIIRPRGGNFIYSSEEIDTMKNDILFCKAKGINGVVFGILNSDNTIDLKLNKELVELSKPMSTAFHRAIDKCENIEEAFKDLISLGFTRVLSAGSKQTAVEGVHVLKALQKKFCNKIILIPAGGIRTSSIELLLKETNCFEYHSAAITGKTDFADAKEIMRLKEKIK